MDKLNEKIKIAATIAALLIAAALVVGATFAWLSISKAPKINKVRSVISNTSIVEIALAHSEYDELNPNTNLASPNQVNFKDKTAIGPGEVSENDKSIGQTTWGRIVTMEDNPIILQAPATFDQNKGISTVAFDDGGRTAGFESLVHGEIGDDGLVYYQRKIKKGDYYVTKDGKTEIATEDGVGYAAAGGVAVWMRSNVEAQIDLVLRGTSILNADPDIPLELFAKVWKLNPNETRKDGSQKGRLQELGTFSCTRHIDENGESSFESTLTSESWNKMVPGTQYLVELICYIEGDREKNDNALISQSMADGAKGREISVKFGDLNYDTLACTPYITVVDAETGGNPFKFGRYYTKHPKLSIGVWSDGEIDSSLGAEMHYVLKKDGVLFNDNAGSVSITKSSDAKEIVLDQDGKYELTAWFTDNEHVDKSGEKIKLYAVNFNSRYLVNLKETNLTLYVDTTPPTITITEPEEGSYHNTEEVKLVMTTDEDNIKQLKIDNHVVKATKHTITTEEGDKTFYTAERTFRNEGDYEVVVSVLDKAHSLLEATRKFVIDRTKPVIDDIKWTFINEGTLSKFLNTITAGQMFIQKIQIDAKATDLHLDQFTAEPSIPSSKVNTRIESSEDGKQKMAIVEIDADYDGTIIFLANDKAGNSERYETEVFTVDNLITNAGADKDDWTKSEDGFKFSLSPDPSNRISTDHYEYSVDGGNNWYSDSRTIGDVHYEIEASTDPATGKLIMGSVVNVKIDDGKAYKGKIRFRAMTTALSTGDYKIYSETSALPGAETGDLDVLLDRKNPTNPDGISARAGEDAISDNTYTNASSVSVLGYGGTAASGIEAYGYSENEVDYTNYPPENAYNVTAEGTTTVYVKAISRVGLASDGRKVFTVKIDRTRPEVEITNAEEINDEGISSVLSSLTGQMFFTNDVELTIKATDESCISKLEWKTTPENEALDSEYVASNEVKELSKTIRIPKEYKGKISFTAYDAAGNVSQTKTIDSLEENPENN